MTALRAARLLALPVRLHGIELGRPVDLRLDRVDFKAIGLDVLCGDGVRRFLPFPIAAVADQEITIRSPFVLLEEDELAFYAARTVALAALRGRDVQRDGRDLGLLEDVVLRRDGTLAEIVVGDQELPFDKSVRIQADSRSEAVS